VTEKEIREAVLTLLARIAPEADLKHLDPGERLQQALDIDSFDYLNFLVAVRDELGVSIAESDYGNVATLDELVAYLGNRL
jgi:acyl carrier protein